MMNYEITKSLDMRLYNYLFSIVYSVPTWFTRLKKEQKSLQPTKSVTDVEITFNTHHHDHNKNQQ